MVLYLALVFGHIYHLSAYTRQVEQQGDLISFINFIY